MGLHKFKKARIDHERPEKSEQQLYTRADTAPELDELDRLVRHFAAAPAQPAAGDDDGDPHRQEGNGERAGQQNANATSPRSLQSSCALPELVGQQLDRAESLLHALRLASAHRRERDVNSDSERPETPERDSRASWQDRVDAIGVVLWNKVTETKMTVSSSTKRRPQTLPRTTLPAKPDASGESPPVRWLSMIARARKLAYLFIQLGSPEPMSRDGRVLLLLILNKVIAETLAATDDPTQLPDLFDAAAAHAQEIHTPISPQTRPSTTPDDVRALSGHYVQRIIFESRRSAFGVAAFVKHRLESLVPSCAPREASPAHAQVESIAHGAFVSAREVLALETFPSTELRDRAKEWLLWSFELAEITPSESARAIKIANLRLLAQIHSHARSWREAEEVVAQLLVSLAPTVQRLVVLSSGCNHSFVFLKIIETTPAMWLRKIRLMIERDAGEGELGQACSNDQELEKHSVQLSAAAQRYHDTHRPASFVMSKRIVSSLRSPVDEVTSRLISQIVMTMTVHSRSNDRPQLADLLHHISSYLGESFALSADSAFVATTYFWRHGDHERAKEAFFEAGEWYTLSLHPLFIENGGIVDAKSMRKAALCYLEIRDFIRAEHTMNLRPDRPPDAKDFFIRFFHATLRQDVEQATQALDGMVKAPDFRYPLLLWACKVANESGITALSTAVLQALLSVHRRGGEGDTQKELLTTVRYVRGWSNEFNTEHPLTSRHSFGWDRSLIRLLASRLESEPDSGAASDIVRNSFGAHLSAVDKDITWLLKTGTVIDPTSIRLKVWLMPCHVPPSGYNLCATYSYRLPTDVITPLYEAVVGLGDLKFGVGTVEDPKLKRTMTFCRVAALSGLLAQARAATSTSDQSKLYSTLLQDTQKLAESVSSNEQSDHTASSALLAFEVEARSGLGDWANVEALFSVSPVGDENLTRPHRDSSCPQRLAAAKEPTVSLSIIKLITARAIRSDDCAPDLLGSILAKTLQTLFYRKDLESTTLAAWLRVMITSLLANAPGEALTYVKHALSFVRTLTGYPRDEVQWLVATTWDRGLDLFSARDIEPAEQWCQLAVQLAQCIDEDEAAMLWRSLEQLRAKMRAFVSTDSDLG
ncbi:BQ2448_3155 [Microbotryum intermedium]|uniref:BQ2448_3155 protein n=1 Tax=Microbotryum intermedium TaxID=269621 RepID=A0A238FEE0_9BASI|nr:BQ2448_3155 [Microbotryum intermedium]